MCQGQRGECEGARVRGAEGRSSRADPVGGGGFLTGKTREILEVPNCREPASPGVHLHMLLQRSMYLYVEALGLILTKCLFSQLQKYIKV